MSREEAMNALIESGMELRRDDIELGKRLERERIIKLLESPEVRAEWIEATSNALPTYQGVIDFLTALIKGEQK